MKKMMNRYTNERIDIIQFSDSDVNDFWNDSSCRRTALLFMLFFMFYFIFIYLLGGELRSHFRLSNVRRVNYESEKEQCVPRNRVDLLYRRSGFSGKVRVAEIKL